MGRINLAFVCGNKDGDPATGLPQRGNEMGQLVFLTCDFEAAFGRPFLALFWHDADSVWFVAQGNLLHLFCRSHLKIEGDCQGVHQGIDIRVPDMTTILTQVCCNAVGTRLLGQLGRPNGIRRVAAARIADGSHVVDVHTQTQIGHKSALLLD